MSDWSQVYYLMAAYYLLAYLFFGNEFPHFTFNLGSQHASRVG